MHILFLPRYSPQGASSRYRIWQYIPSFERAGHTVEVRSLLDSGYLTQLYNSGTRGVGWLAKGYARRLLSAIRPRSFDAVICEQEALPYFPDVFETLFRKNDTPLFLDFDDAAHIKYENVRFLQKKIPRLVAAAETVVVGNAYLAQYARQFSEKVCIIPTVVDLSRYPLRQTWSERDQVVIGWIGIPATAELLKPLISVFQKLQQHFPQLVFRFIGTGPNFPANGFNADFPHWSEQTEAGLLERCDIGIMPMPDNNFTRGKCGLKLIQYMASSMPVVASPVGANCEIVTEDETGFFANSDEQWFAKLKTLIEAPRLRHEFGTAGRAKVEKRYSLERGFAQWTEILERTMLPAQQPAYSKGSRANLTRAVPDPVIRREE
jgi:glycosyltransferase involved in cell wall biosynthesis